MSDDRSDREAPGGEATVEPTDERLIDGPDPLDAQLPATLEEALGRLLGERPVETLGDWVTAVRRHVGGSIAVEDLCHADGETDHWGELDGEHYYFRCFYDAVVLAGLVDEPVDIRTESPDGAVIQARAVGTAEVTVDPPDAVVSFGVAEGVEPPDGDPTHADVYGAVCPYVRAFPDRDAYERWAASVSATTVAVPFADATDVAAALVE